MIKNLTEFIALLRKENEIVEISAQVNPYLEIAEIHRRVIAAEGPALLFTNVQGSTFPVVTNLFGTQKRVQLAFGKKPQELIKKITELPENLFPPTPQKLWKEKQTFFDFLKIGLKKQKNGSVTEVTQVPPKMKNLPLLTSWLEDGGAFVTLPLVYTEHPETKMHNLGMYRIHRYDDKTTGIHWQIGKGGGFHYAVAESKKQPLPMNLNIGGPPALILSAIAPLPENVGELLLASLVLGEKLALCENPAGTLPLIAEAEFVAVGKVPPFKRQPEGPFGDHYGYYSLQHDYPVFEIDAIFHKKNAVFPATIVGKPKQEDFFIGDYLQELLSPLFPLVMPSVTDLWSFGETGYHALSAAVVRERYTREGLAGAFRILGEGQLSLTKFLLLTDKPQNLKDFKSLLVYILERTDFAKDLYIFDNLSMDTLDYSGPSVNKGSKGILAGFGKPVRELPKETPNLEECSGLINDASLFCDGCLVVEGERYAKNPALAQEITKLSALKDFPLVILADSAKETTSTTSRFLWTVFTRFEPAADICTKSSFIRRNSIVYENPIVIDARRKTPYPKELFCDEKTAKLVDNRWNDYFPNKNVKMGESDKAHLDK
ncbi:UbiD family decarboxylase [bacterium]|nr:UbiD family decarboxylase [bacterium]